jgi:hypothetical protein
MDADQIIGLFKDLNKRNKYFQNRHPFFMAFYYRQIFCFYYNKKKVGSIEDLLERIIAKPPKIT